MEVYHEAEHYRAPDDERPALKNQPQRYPNRGAWVRRLDHVNVLCNDVTSNRRFMEETLGFNTREQVILDDSTEAGSWLSVTPLTHDIAYTLDAYTGARTPPHQQPATSITARISSAPPTSSSKGATSSRPAPLSTPSPRLSSSMATSQAATVSNSSRAAT